MEKDNCKNQDFSEQVQYNLKIQEPSIPIIQIKKQNSNRKFRRKRNQDDEESFDIAHLSIIDKNASRLNKYWRKKDNILYMKFLFFNAHMFINQMARRQNKVFMKMSKAMKKIKSPLQCKSHHQKMSNQTAHGTTDEIIQYILKMLNDDKLRQSIKRQYQRKLKTLPNLLVSDKLKQFLNTQLNENSIQKIHKQIEKKRNISVKMQSQNKETLKVQFDKEKYQIQFDNKRNCFRVSIDMTNCQYETW